MSPETIIELLHARPFRPLVFRFNDGSHITVLHPELVIVEQDTVWFFRPSDGERIAEGFRVGALQNLTTIEPAEVATS